MTIHPKGQLALKDIADLAGVSRPAVSNWRARNSHTFPEPAKDSPPRRPLFEFSEVLRWLRSEGHLPENWEANAVRLIITSAINPLRIAVSDTADAAILSLAILAASKDTNGKMGDEWSNVGGEASNVHDALREVLSQLDQDLLHEDDLVRVLESVSSVSASILSDLVDALTQVGEDNYSTASRIIIESFFGSGGRSTFSQYSTISSPVSSLIANAAATTVSAGARIFDPTCGIAGTLLALAEKSTGLILFGNDRDQKAVTIASLHGYVAEVPGTFTSTNIFTEDPHPESPFHTIVCEPPFSLRLAEVELASVSTSLQTSLGVTVPSSLASDAAFLAYPLNHLDSEGRAYVLTNLSTCSHGRLAEFRKNLVARGAVEAVIQLPRKLLSYTSLATALWVLRAPDARRSMDPVLLADASDVQNPEDQIAEWLQAMREGRESSVPTGATTLAEMITEGGTLLPSVILHRVQDTGEVSLKYRESWSRLTDTVKSVSDTLSEMSGSAEELPTSSASIPLTELKSVTRISTRYRKSNEEPPEDPVTAKLIPFRDPGKPAEEVYIESGADTARPGDVLVPNQVGVPARVFRTEEGTWVAPSGMFLLRVSGDQFDPEYLAACINAPFNELNHGGIIPRRKLPEIDVPLLSWAEQQKVLGIASQLRRMAGEARELSKQAEETLGAALKVIRFGADEP